MGSKIEYVESSHIYATTYVRNSKGIGVLWAIFTICYAIISVVAFITPEWIGDIEAENPARFGLWTVCQAEENGEQCQGRLDDFPAISSTAFQAATVFVGVAVIFAILTLCAMVLFFFCQSTSVFHICGWMQIISGLFFLFFSVIFLCGSRMLSSVTDVMLRNLIFSVTVNFHLEYLR